MALQTTLGLTVSASHTKAIDLGIGTLPLVFSPTFTLTSGTGAGQVDRIFSDTRTIAIGGSETLDLAGTLVDIFGDLFTLARVKALIIRAAPANLSNIIIGPNTSNGWATMFGDASDRLRIRPGGLFVAACSEAVGYAVTAGTGDLLLVINDSGLATATYDVIIVGASA